MSAKNIEEKREYARKYMAEYLVVNREKINARHRELYKANRERYIGYVRKYEKAHLDLVNKKRRERRKNKRIAAGKPLQKKRDPLRKKMDHAEEMQEWRLLNPDKARALRHNYKARKRGNGGRHTGEELKELFETQEGKCFYCGELIYSSFDKELHVDHKTPLIRGGNNNIENIALACSKCNLSKHTKTAEEFVMEE